MASRDSSIRSAARATSSAYKRLPIRWRLRRRLRGPHAGDPVRLRGDRRHPHHAPDPRRLPPRGGRERRPPRAPGASCGSTTTRRATRRAIGAGHDRPRRLRVVLGRRHPRDHGRRPRRLRHRQRARLRAAAWPAPPRSTAIASRPARCRSRARTPWALQYARRISDVQETANRVKVFLAFGVLGGALLALLAGLATARRAMEPIAELSAAARRIERSRDPSERIPHPEADDEVAELARTLEAMLASLDAARGETEASLTRQREFVADASHELRTPLTSVLANLELLEEELSGRAARGGGVRSALVAADAPPGGRPAAARPRRRRPRRPAPAGRPVGGRHRRRRRARAGRRRPRDLGVGSLRRARRRRPRRAAPAGPEPDGERAPPHRSRHRGRGHRRAPQRRGRARGRGRRPGIPLDQREKVFERFYRGSGEHSGSSGSACRSCARSPSRTAAASGSRSRSTAAGRASWSGSLRPDVLVEPQHVLRVVAALERGQPAYVSAP